MEWIVDFIIEVAQFLDEVPDLEDFWELRQTVSLGSSCLLVLLNSALTGGSRTPYLYKLPALEIGRKFSTYKGSSTGRSRHSYSYHPHCAFGYWSIEPLALSSRTLF
jgi:hypothetical protein